MSAINEAIRREDIRISKKYKIFKELICIELQGDINGKRNT